MLSKKNRLNKKRDFENVFRKGKSFKEDLLLLKITEGKTSQSRFGLIVSKKISKKATIRNKLKRRISELVGKEIKNLPKSMDIVIVTFPGIEKKDFLEIEKIIKKLFKKVTLFQS